jgi:hypothetical protein
MENVFADTLGDFPECSCQYLTLTGQAGVRSLTSVAK